MLNQWGLDAHLERLRCSASTARAFGNDRLFGFSPQGQMSREDCGKPTVISDRSKTAGSLFHFGRSPYRKTLYFLGDLKRV